MPPAPVWRGCRHGITMLRLEFYKMSPGGNPTILIAAPKIAAPQRAAVASALMHPLHLQAEQVGFVDLDARPPRLDMMGGEFCLNASRCLALLLAHAGRLSGAGATEEISVSGLAEPVRVKIQTVAPEDGADQEPVRLDCGVRIPCPALEGRDCTKCMDEPEKGIIVVRLPGVTHVLLDSADHPRPDSQAEFFAQAEKLRESLRLTDEGACGVIWHAAADCGGGVRAGQIWPVVHVRDTNSTFFESACGSASLALALLLRGACGAASLAVRQPSGADLRIDFEKNGLFAWVSGPVHLLAKGDCYADL